jgi:hypothetical protein
LERR